MFELVLGMCSGPSRCKRWHLLADMQVYGSELAKEINSVISRNSLTQPGIKRSLKSTATV